MTDEEILEAFRRHEDKRPVDIEQEVYYESSTARILAQDFIDAIEEAIAEAPADLQDSAIVKIRGIGSDEYEPGFELTVIHQREESDAEYLSRARAWHHGKQAERARELAQLARLQEKYAKDGA